MKLIIATTAALLAGAAFAQSTAPAPAAAPMAPAPMEAPAAPAPAADPAPAASAAATMSVKDGKWTMGDRKATKAEIAQWKKENPSMSKPM